MPISLNWSDLRTEGMPAVYRALEQLAKKLNQVESQQGVALHLVERRLATLEFLVSEELIRVAPAVTGQKGGVLVELAQEIDRLRADVAWLRRLVGERTGPRIECDGRPCTSQDGTDTVSGDDVALAWTTTTTGAGKGADDDTTAGSMADRTAGGDECGRSG